MSNTSVGGVYERVIQETIDHSQMDFQDSGVDTGTLDMLKEVWQQKLSALQVCHFPWDPAPPSPQAVVGDVGDVTAADGTRIKPEPGSEAGMNNGTPQGQPLSDPDLAAARAAQHVQQKLGVSAVPPSTTNRTNTPSFPSSGLMLPGKPQTSPQQPSPIGGQTDGAGDVDDAPGEVIITQEDADGEINRVIAEGNLMRAQESALRSALEQLKTQSATFESRRMQRRYRGVTEESTSVHTSTNSAMLSTSLQIPQTDGPVGDDPLDDEAINSDLDDPDDELGSDDDEVEGVVPQIMLCMYDKVQRTKNKWKCVLKDGVMTVNGKEYVFHKANGEYEW